jgi:hypothetical protein
MATSCACTFFEVPFTALLHFHQDDFFEKKILKRKNDKKNLSETKNFKRCAFITLTFRFEGTRTQKLQFAVSNQVKPNLWPQTCSTALSTKGHATGWGGRWLWTVYRGGCPIKTLREKQALLLMPD